MYRQFYFRTVHETLSSQQPPALRSPRSLLQPARSGPLLVDSDDLASAQVTGHHSCVPNPCICCHCSLNDGAPLACPSPGLLCAGAPVGRLRPSVVKAAPRSCGLFIGACLLAQAGSYCIRPCPFRALARRLRRSCFGAGNGTPLACPQSLHLLPLLVYRRRSTHVPKTRPTLRWGSRRPTLPGLLTDAPARACGLSIPAVPPFQFHISDTDGLRRSEFLRGIRPPTRCTGVGGCGAGGEVRWGRWSGVGWGGGEGLEVWVRLEVRERVSLF